MQILVIVNQEDKWTGGAIASFFKIYLELFFFPIEFIALISQQL